jgi:hypothetical protein
LDKDGTANPYDQASGSYTQSGIGILGIRWSHEETTADKESEHSERHDSAQHDTLAQTVIGISAMVMAPTMALIPMAAPIPNLRLQMQGPEDS